MKLEGIFKNILVEVATPYNVGMGFVAKKQGLIITNEHIVAGNQEVIINGVKNTGLKKTLTRVLYTDAIYDIAFLALPENWNVPSVELASHLDINEDDAWMVSEVDKSSSIQTRILTHALEFDEITYVEIIDTIDAIISGSPLLNQMGEIIGVTTAVPAYYTEGGFALSSVNLKNIIDTFQHTQATEATRCLNCKTVVSNLNIKNKYCPQCQHPVTLPSAELPFIPYGINQRIEELIIAIGHDAKLARRGPNSWEIREGSAYIQISYYEKQGYIIGDAFLCCIKDPIKPQLYQYLLKQNYTIEGLNFSIKEEDVVLSLLVSERDLNMDIGRKLFQHLFNCADYFDNILVEQYGAVWK